MSRSTPAGDRRATLTSILLNDAEPDSVEEALTEEIGAEEVFQEKKRMRSNGGKFTISDLCRIASNAQLENACHALDLKVPKTPGY